MSEPFIGEIRLFSGNTIPQGWAACNGQILTINNNQALFTILGNAYGGDGRTTFALPDLRGRVPIQMQSVTAVGQAGGEENHTLTINEIPQHNHIALAGADSTLNTPVANVWGGGGVNNYEFQPNVLMSQNSLAVSGGSQPHSNMQPYITLNFCIAIQGFYPSRN